MTTSLSDCLSKASKPLWEGPYGQGKNGGITFSMLSRWLQCRERFRLYAIEGLRPFDGFNLPIHFGSMWHVCEEALAKCGVKGHREVHIRPLNEYAQGMVATYPNSAEKIEHWYNVIKVQFPEYVKYWQSHPDMIKRQPMLAEQVFDTPFKLPSGRIVRLRGKWDSVDLVDGKIWLMENKTKSDIDVIQLQRQLKFDLQTMLYLTALEELKSTVSKAYIWDKLLKYPIEGVRYNVIRRDCPIRMHKAKAKTPAETPEHFYNRLKVDYFQAEPENWFVRFNVEVNQQDIQRFRDTCLIPMLENVCCWYDEVAKVPRGIQDDSPTSYNWVHPYGVRNLINEGATGEYDHCIETGSRVGLVKMDKLFEELQ